MCALDALSAIPRGNTKRYYTCNRNIICRAASLVREVPNGELDAPLHFWVGEGIGKIFHPLQSSKRPQRQPPAFAKTSRKPTHRHTGGVGFMLQERRWQLRSTQTHTYTRIHTSPGARFCEKRERDRYIERKREGECDHPAAGVRDGGDTQAHCKRVEKRHPTAPHQPPSFWRARREGDERDGNELEPGVDHVPCKKTPTESEQE